MITSDTHAAPKPLSAPAAPVNLSPNPLPMSTPTFDAEALKATADRLALASGMPIYGGDAVVRPDGSTALIDFNDFPSFGGCTRTAAKAIADHVAARLSEGSTFLTNS